MRLTHVRLLVADMRAAYRFYAQALGLATEWPENDGYAEFAVGDGVFLSIFPRAEMAEVVDVGEPAGDGVVVVLQVEDVHATVAELRQRGVEPLSDPVDRTDWGLRVAHVRDPDGHLVELYQDIDGVRA